MSDLSKIQSIVAPLATPAAPALMLGNNLYGGMLNAGIPWGIALIGAFTATVGMELSGMLMCSMALKAFRKQAFGVMWLAIGGALVYAMFVFFGIYTAKNAGTFATMVFITLIAYLGSGIYQYFQDMTGEAELGIKETDAQRKLVAAQARLAKASNGVQSVQSVHRTSVQGLDPDKLRITRDIISKNPNATTREIAAALGFASPSSGKAYKDAVTK